MAKSHNVGKNNPMYGKKGKNHPAYKNGCRCEQHHCKCGNPICYKTWQRNGECKFCAMKGAKNPCFGKKHSEKTILKMRKVKLGRNNSNWKNGITPLRKSIRDCYRYRLWRSDVLTRDDFTCQICNKHGGKLEVDHYPKRFSVIFHENKIKNLQQALDCEEFWNINNGRTLCEKCHYKISIGSKRHDKTTS